jgi:hypothetical protein
MRQSRFAFGGGREDWCRLVNCSHFSRDSAITHFFVITITKGLIVIGLTQYIREHSLEVSGDGRVRKLVFGRWRRGD